MINEKKETMIKFAFTTVATTSGAKIITWAFGPYVNHISHCVTFDNEMLSIYKWKRKKKKIEIIEQFEIKKSDIKKVKRIFWYIGFIFNIALKRYKVYLNNGNTIIIQVHKFIGKKHEKLNKSFPFKDINMAYDFKTQTEFKKELTRLSKIK